MSVLCGYSIVLNRFTAVSNFLYAADLISMRSTALYPWHVITLNSPFRFIHFFFISTTHLTWVNCVKFRYFRMRERIWLNSSFASEYGKFGVTKCENCHKIYLQKYSKRSM